MRVVFLVALFALSFFWPTTSSAAAPPYDGVLSLSPVGEHSCLAVALPVTAGRPIAGLSWLHNDAGTVFPKLLLLEGEATSPPDLTQTSLVLEEVTGASLGTGEVTFETPITSSTNWIYAVFQLPAFTEKTGDGFGGGPGIGYVRERGAGTAYVSGAGFAWTRLHPSFSLQVQTQPALAKGASQAQPLSELRSSRPAGWWDDLVRPEGPQEVAQSGDAAPLVSTAKPLAVVPNPFNPRATVHFYAEQGGLVTIDVYDLRGRHVRHLLDEEVSTGQHEVVWQGVDDRGATVASGAYLVRLKTAGEVHQARAVLVR